MKNSCVHQINLINVNLTKTIDIKHVHIKTQLILLLLTDINQVTILAINKRII